MSSSPILVTGGTGNIGAALVRMLVESGHAVRVVTRDRARAAGALGATVEIVEGDLARPESLAAALGGVERAFFLGNAGPELGGIAGGFAAAAREARVQHVVAVSSGTVEIVPRIALGAWHVAMEHAMTETGIATTYLRPDNFASNARRWAPMIRAKSAVFSPHPDAQSVPIDPHDIAAVAHAALTQLGHENQIYTLSGPEVMSTRDQVAVIGAELGRALQVVDQPMAKARDGMIKSGVPAIMADAIGEVFGHAPRPTTTVADVTRQKPRTFAAWVKANRAAFA